MTLTTLTCKKSRPLLLLLLPLLLLLLLLLLPLLLLLQSVEAVADRVGVASLEHLLDPRKKASEGRVHTARLTAWLTGRLAAGLTHVGTQ